MCLCHCEMMQQLCVDLMLRNLCRQFIFMFCTKLFEVLCFSETVETVAASQ